MSRRVCSAAVCFAGLALFSAGAAELKLLFPLGRQAYQTNEGVDVAVVRTSSDALQAGELALKLTSDNGSAATLTWPVLGAAVEGKGAQRTEHLRLNGRLLRPGHYTVEAACDGATQQAEVDICSHIRKTTFRLVDWGGSGKGPEQIRAGEDATGINLMYGAYGGHDQDANIRGGMDYMRCCAMGGAHQMDMRLECDWSDPYVLAGGMSRVARQALNDRRASNVIGVHFYDEPGLTWLKHPKTGVFSAHNIPAQDWAFKAAWGKDALQYTDVKPDDAASVAAWEEWLRWKQVFMEAAWRVSQFSVSHVDPAFISTTQSMYAWHAFGDGYYFHVVRPLQVMTGHGGYDDYASGYLNPGFFFEFGRIRDCNKPVWYLPQWWDRIPSDLFRLEQYLTFMAHAQGLCIPPATETHAPGARPQDDGMVESNRLMARLGTVFTTMPVTRGDVAVLYSMSQNVKANVTSENMLNVQDFAGQIERLLLLYVASKMAHIPLFPVVEEDVLDGAVAANHKAIILTGLEVLDPKVVAALRAFVAGGGKVILGDECKVEIPGAVKLGAAITDKIYIEAKKEFTSGDEKTRRTRGCCTRGPLAYFREGAPVAQALAARCKELGIAPILECDEPQVFVARHAYGDVEYLFLVNAAADPETLKTGEWNGIRAAEAKVALLDDGRPLYDAVLGGGAREFKQDQGRLAAVLRFGPGQLRAFARTARPIGGVQVLTPALPGADYASDGVMPSRLEVQAAVTDDQGKVLNGSLPLSVQLVDPLGVKRYDLCRATERGFLKLDLQFGVNEPAGEWRVVVRELLNGKQGTASFRNRAPAHCGALAGAQRRAVLFPADHERIFRFFRLHKDVALVTGAAGHNKAHAERLAEDLKRWGIRSRIVPAADIKPKAIPPDVKRTWSGAVGNPNLDLPGEAAILLGTPDDNPIIKAMLPQPGGLAILPYAPAKDSFPGRGRGMLAWQTDAVAFYNYETITCIAYDADGMAEAAGTLFELASGYRPSTDLVLPATAAAAPATKAPGLVPEAETVWEVALPDRAVTLAVQGDQIEALSLEGSVTRIGADGKVASQQAGDSQKAAEAYKAYCGKRPPVDVDKALLVPAKVAKFAAKSDALTAVAYWGGLLRIHDAQGQAVAQQMLPQDFAALAWLGDRLIVALADGRVVALQTKR